MANWNELSNSQLQEEIISEGLLDNVASLTRKEMIECLREHYRFRRFAPEEVLSESEKVFSEKNRGRLFALDSILGWGIDSWIVRSVTGVMVVVLASSGIQLINNKIWNEDQFLGDLSSLRLRIGYDYSGSYYFLVNSNETIARDYKERLLTHLQIDSQGRLLYNSRPIIFFQKGDFVGSDQQPLYLTPGNTFRDSSGKEYRRTSPGDSSSRLQRYF